MTDIDVLTNGVRVTPNGALVPVAYQVLDGDHNLLLVTGDSAKALRKIRRAESGFDRVGAPDPRPRHRRDGVPAVDEEGEGAPRIFTLIYMDGVVVVTVGRLPGPK